VKRIVDEHHTVADEAVVTDGHEVADERMRLNPAPAADGGATLDLDERADERVGTNAASVQVRGLDHRDVLAEFDVDDS
jgi:hypothetical protein